LSPIPADYDDLIAEMEESGGGTSYDFRRKCAAKAYSATAAYDSMISQWFAFADQQQLFPDMLAINGNRADELRYGENPHQRAALYLPVGPHGSGIAQAEQVQGKELSYNNYNDADAALELVSEFRDGPPTVVIVKHANPCGVASGRYADRGLSRCAGMRQRLGLWRDCRGQPPTRWRDGRGDYRDFHRGRCRACRRRCGQGGVCQEEESAPVADRRSARSESAAG
jgi:hypothetical protein